MKRSAKKNSKIPASAATKSVSGLPISAPSGSRSRKTAARSAPAANGIPRLAKRLATFLLISSEAANVSERSPPIRLKIIMYVKRFTLSSIPWFTQDS